MLQASLQMTVTRGTAQDDNRNALIRQAADSPLLTSLPYFERYSREPHFVLSVYADMLKIRAPEQKQIHPQKNAGTRGKVVGFSAKSRKRLIEFMASVRYSGTLLFATLTYPDVFPVGEPDVWRRHFEAFRDRFEHHFPTYRGLWRIEFQDRKSGLYKGEIAPHFHIMIFTTLDSTSGHQEELATTLYGELAPMWHEVTGSFDPEHLIHGVHVSPVRSRRHAYAYVSKYVAKTENDTLEVGRRWGRIGRFNIDPSIELILTRGEYFALKRIIKRWLKNQGRKFWRKFAKLNCALGCTIFGLGDGQTDETFNDMAGWLQFLHAARVHAGMEYPPLVI